MAARLSHTPDLCWVGREGTTRQQLLSGLHAVLAFLTLYMGPIPKHVLGQGKYLLQWGRKVKKNQSLCPQNVNEMDLQSHNQEQRNIKEI